MDSSLTVHQSSALALRRRHRGLFERLLSPLFKRVRVDPEAIERLATAHEKGVVVHTIRSHRVIDPYFVLYALDRLGLPRPLWMHDHRAGQIEGDVAHLNATVLSESPALLFLKKRRTITDPSNAYTTKHVEALVGLQRKMDRPILLVPETVLFTKSAAGLKRNTIDSIFGDRESPGRIRELLGFLWYLSGSRYHVGEPVDIQAVIEREEGGSDEVIAKKIRWSLLHHLSREEQLRVGPMYKSADRSRQAIVNDTEVRRYITDQTKRGANLEELEKRAKEMVRTIAADPRYYWIKFLDGIADFAWHRIYDGIIVDEAGFERVRRAARRGPVVLVPSHKSHVDYLVLSQVFFKDGMMPPHIAAGDNLNFPPIGLIFRRAGAFFIRRTFKGDKLYATVFAAYVRRLLKDGNAIEFFIEGGRSRTGKLRQPKMGMLRMSVDPVLDGVINDVTFVPVSISYEKIVEGRSYAKELAGGAKKKEDVGALLSTTKVLRSKYGRVYVDFAEPISLRVFSAARGFTVPTEPIEPNPDEPQPDRRALISRLGHRLVYGINDVTRVTPTSIAALILLSRTRGGIAGEEIFDRADRILGFLEQIGARLSRTLGSRARADSRVAALREAMGRLAADGLVQMLPAPDGETIYRVTDEGRSPLNYYKNNILHYFVPYTIIALAILLAKQRFAPEKEVLEITKRLSRLLRFEFSFHDRGLEENFKQAAKVLVKRRTLARLEEEEEVSWMITRAGRAEAQELAELLATFFEAFRLTAECLVDLSLPMPHKKFTSHALLLARRRAMEGRITHGEAASLPTFKAALDLMEEEGIIACQGKTIQTINEDARLKLIEEMDTYLKAPLQS